MNINDITYGINGAVFDVNRVLGPGLLEKVYENALVFEIKYPAAEQRGIGVALRTIGGAGNRRKTSPNAVSEKRCLICLCMPTVSLSGFRYQKLDGRL